MRQIPYDPFIYGWLEERKADGHSLNSSMIEWILSTKELRKRKMTKYNSHDYGTLPKEDDEMIELLQKIIEIWSEE